MIDRIRNLEASGPGDWHRLNVVNSLFCEVLISFFCVTEVDSYFHRAVLPLAFSSFTVHYVPLFVYASSIRRWSSTPSCSCPLFPPVDSNVSIVT